METITLTLPLTASALRRGAEMLTGMAADAIVTAEVRVPTASGLDPARSPIAERIEEPDLQTARGAESAQHAAPPGPNNGLTSPEGAEVDMKGVPFDAGYCGQAAEPFYSSGPRSGQWKKKRGVSDAEYDKWYAHRLSMVSGGDPVQQEQQVNAAGAFTAPQQQQQPEPANDIPQDAGKFMGWVAEKQAAQLLTNDDIQAAWAGENLVVGDIFPPNDEATIRQRIEAMYHRLNWHMRQRQQGA